MGVAVIRCVAAEDLQLSVLHRGRRAIHRHKIRCLRQKIIACELDKVEHSHIATAWTLYILHRRPGM